MKIESILTALFIFMLKDYDRLEDGEERNNLAKLILGVDEKLRKGNFVEHMFEDAGLVEPTEI